MATDRYVPQRPSVRRPTSLLREILDARVDFEDYLATELQLNATDLAAMEALIRSGGALSPSDLAKRLRLSSGAVTTMIDRLEAAGHVQRASVADDRRRVIVRAAPASMRRAMGILEPMVQATDNVLNGFNADDISAITIYLERVLETYRRAAHADSDEIG